jgi:hypothetical protein
MDDFELCAGSSADGCGHERILRMHFDYLANIVQTLAVDWNTKRGN